MENDFIKAWKSACEYKQKEIDELEKEKDYLCNKMENTREIYKNSQKLQTENAKLRECVEWYANEDNHYLSKTDFGKRARQVLKELEDK